ncbi:MAG: heme exporter protein CcmB [Acidobacteriota bacterium]
MIGILRSAWLIAEKDLKVESRSRELVYTTLFFAVTAVLIFAFSFVQEDSSIPAGSASGILWVTLTFSGTIALTRTFEREREHDTLRGLLLSPVERPAVYLGKLMAVLLLLAGVELVLVPLTGLFFQAPLGRAPWLLFALLATGTLGFASVGTLFAAMLVRARSRDVLLPVVLFPIIVPVIIAGVRGTNALFTPETDVAVARMWLAMLVSFDAVFLSLALWTCGPLLGE